MNKKDILALSNSELVAHSMHINSIITKEANSRGSITAKSRKDFIWAVEELAKRFDLDIEVLKCNTDSEHWWK